MILIIVKKIVVLEDAIIENGERVELYTSVTNQDSEDVNTYFDGFIPKNGYIEVLSEKIDGKLKIIAKNNVPNIIKKDKKRNLNNYNDLMTTRYGNTGTYLIEKGTIIGITIKNEKQKVLTYI